MALKSPPFPEKGAEWPADTRADDASSGTGAEGRFTRRFTASDRTTRVVLAALDARLVKLGVDEDDRASAELILAEALNNICEHAYAGKGGPVEMIVDIRRAGLTCLLCDCGQPIPGGAPPGGGLPIIDPPDNVPEGGFGWHIIRCLSTDLRYRRDNGWNRLSFRVIFASFD
ncbi:MAG: ATP-binding protein [Pararhodobacter sp.]|nr:ATP-binding protein [Pararhodobacter sp.]